MNVIELFAGVGGFRVGLEKASKNFSIIWGNQWEPSKKAQDAFNCYSKNFDGQGLHSNKDISTVDFEEIPQDFELLVGGFPCQDYSVARSLSGEKGIQGKKGVLFWQIMRFVNHFHPNYVLLENVDRLLKSPSKQRGRDFAIMLASFRDAGYNLEWRVINAADYGFVQRRRRVFIFAYKKDSPFGLTVINSNPSNQVHQDGFFASKFPVLEEAFEKKAIEPFELPTDIVELSDSFTKTFLKAGTMIDGNVNTYEVIPVECEQTPLSSVLETEVNEKYFLTPEQKAKVKSMKDAKKIERTTAEGYTYTFSEGGMSCPDDASKPARTMLTSEGTVNRSSHIVYHPNTKRWRFITPKECERLNGFKDNWTDTGMSDRMRYFCMGNALVVGLIEKMGQRIMEVETNNICEDSEDSVELSRV
jgi:DNA (cytosine-5)-methyltransferase 1